MHLRVDFDAAHGLGSTRAQQDREAAHTAAFLLRQLRGSASGTELLAEIQQIRAEYEFQAGKINNDSAQVGLDSIPRRPRIGPRVQRHPDQRRTAEH
jgi:hypothetical protein